MGTYSIEFFGIATSVVLFLIGYRQTVGAKKERVNAANADLEKTLIRRIVLEKYVPDLLDLSRLTQGKARDYRVHEADMLSEAQLMNAVYTRVMESDLIAAEERQQILSRILPALSASELRSISEGAISEITVSGHRGRGTSLVTALMAVLASLLGALITVLPEIRSFQPQMRRILPLAAASVAGSLGIIALVYSAFRLKAAEEGDPSRRTEILQYVEFEAEVRKVLEDFGDLEMAPEADAGYDYLLRRTGKPILIEIKAWPRPMPVEVLDRLADRLRSAARKMGAEESIIVRKTSDDPVSGIVRIGGPDVKVMTITQLRNYLSHR